MTPKQFDFYAQALVERNGLQMDTAYMSAEIQSISRVAEYKDRQIDNYRKIVINNDSILKEFEISFKKISKDYQKSQKRLRRTRQVAMGLGLVSCVLAIIVILK